MEKIIKGIDSILPALLDAEIDPIARAIMTTDSVPKIASVTHEGIVVTGIAKGAGMLAPALATMLSVVMTDAVVDRSTLQKVFHRVTDRTYNRIDSDGCTSTNDTVLLLASGASGKKISQQNLEALLMEVCRSLSAQLIQDAEGHTKVVSIDVRNAKSEEDAVEVGRACARNNLLKCALFGGDPNWGRILAAIGTANAEFDSLNLDVWLNGVKVAEQSAPGEDASQIDLSGKEISIIIDLKSGGSSAVIMTNDLSHDYVHENSAYAT